jgi:hypothetical protein
MSGRFTSADPKLAISGRISPIPSISKTVVRTTKDIPNANSLL